MPKNTPQLDALQQLEAAKAKTLEMGGSEKVAKQHARNRLTARERIDKLLDKGSFYEMGQLAHSDLPEAAEQTPADGKVCGFGKIEGRQIGITSDDATVMAGSGGRIGYQKEFKTHDYARQRGIPSVHLGDGGGARIPDIMGATGMMSFAYDIQHPPRDRYTPLITAIMGECYGGPTWKASNSDIIVQVKGSTMAVSGPPVLEAATGEKVSPEMLGGWQVHAKKTGLVDFFAENDEDALKLIRRILQYLPNNAQELPPSQSYEASERSFKQERLLSLIPDNARMVYDMHELLEIVFDKGSLLELKADYDGSLITTWARLKGQVVGVLANNPKVNAGAMGYGACEKATSFICLCDAFNIPLIFIHDTPGFYVSKAAEERQMPIKIMNFIQALQHSTVPRLSLIARKSYGMAHCNMVGANMGADVLLAYPKADISFMAPEVACNVMLGRKLKGNENAENMRAAFIAEMQSSNTPWKAAGQNLIDRIIDPRDTREELSQALEIARGAQQNGGKSKRLMANWPKIL